MSGILCRENYGRILIAEIIDGFMKLPQWTKHEYTTELLYHFNCGKCKKWWSYATTQEKDMEDESMHCPHCGEDGECKEKTNG